MRRGVEGWGWIRCALLVTRPSLTFSRVRSKTRFKRITRCRALPLRSSPLNHRGCVNAIWPPERFSQVFYIVNLYGRYFKLVLAIEFSEEHQFRWWPNRFHEPPVVTSGRHEQVMGGLTQGVWLGSQRHAAPLPRRWHWCWAPLACHSKLVPHWVTTCARLVPS